MRANAMMMMTGLVVSGSAMAALPPCLRPYSAAGVANPGFNANDPRIVGDGAGGYYQKMTGVQIGMCTGTNSQCGDSAKASGLMDSFSSSVTISTAAAGYAPTGSISDFARIDACQNLIEGTSIQKARTGSPSDPQNLAGRKIPQLDSNGRYQANSGAEFSRVVPVMSGAVAGYNNLPWTANGKTIKYQTIAPNNFTSIGVSHVESWARITTTGTTTIDAAFANYLGTNYAFMEAVVSSSSASVMAAKIASGASKFGNFYGSTADALAIQAGGRTVLTFQCPDDMSLAGQDNNDLATLGYTRRSFFLPPAELTAGANALDMAVLEASDAGRPPPATNSIPVLRAYLSTLSSDPRVVDVDIVRRFGLGQWGVLFAATQYTVPAEVASGAPKALDYFLSPTNPKPIALPYSWAYTYLNKMTYTPLVATATTAFDGFYWDVRASMLCRPKHVSYDFADPNGGRSLN